MHERDMDSSTLTFSCGSSIKEPGSTASSRPPSRGSRSDDARTRESGGRRERPGTCETPAAPGAAATDEDELTEADISVKREGAGRGLLWDEEEDDPYVSKQPRAWELN